MTTWLLDWGDYDGSRTFKHDPKYNITDRDEIYVYRDGDLVGPFEPLTTSNVRESSSADAETETTQLVPLRNEHELIVCDIFDREELPTRKITEKFRDVLNRKESFETVEPTDFFEDEQDDVDDEHSGGNTTEEHEPDSLQDVFIHNIDAEDEDFDGETVTGGKTLSDVSLRGASFTDAKMEGVTFENVSLRDADFRGAKLENVTFTGFRTELAGANFDGAVLTNATIEVSVAGCSFVGAQMREADLRKAILKDADFSEAKMKRVRLEGTRPHRATFDGAILQNIRATGATFEDTSFVGADIKGTTFSTVTFENVNLTGSNLSRTEFHNCNLIDVTFRRANARYLELTDHTESDAEDLDFERADLTDASLRNTAFKSARFDGARLTRTDFSRCNLSGASLADVRADGANFSEANLEAATLAQADLTNATFENARLYACQLGGVRVGSETPFFNVYDYRDDEKNTEDTRGYEEGPNRRAASVYRTLEAVYRDNALTDESLRYHRKQKAASLRADLDEGKWFSPTVDLFLGVTTAHGTKVWPLVVCSTVVITIFGVIYGHTGVMAHETLGQLEISGVNTESLDSLLYLLLFSVLSFTGLGYGQFTPLTGAAALSAAFQTSLGIVAFGLLIFVLSTRASR